VVDGWQRAADLSPDQIEGYRPTPEDLKVGEALLAGNTTLARIAEYTSLSGDECKATLNSPLAMAWLSRQISALFCTRAALIDATLYTRAMTGDLAAIKLFYDRMRLLDKGMEIKHTYSGEVSLKNVPDDELTRIVQDKARLLPAEFRVLNQEPEVRGLDDNPPSSKEKE
jgi:hypothetical protein